MYAKQPKKLIIMNILDILSAGLEKYQNKER